MRRFALVWATIAAGLAAPADGLVQSAAPTSTQSTMFDAVPHRRCFAGRAGLIA